VNEVKPTDIRDPEYFHKVVDCQYACPAHTPVPEYIRLIAQERYDDAYMVNWESNVFPGILGRTCDRPANPLVVVGASKKNLWQFADSNGSPQITKALLSIACQQSQDAKMAKKSP
jgi:hypothetical protein